MPPAKVLLYASIASVTNDIAWIFHWIFEREKEQCILNN